MTTAQKSHISVPLTWYKVYMRLAQVMKGCKASNFALFEIDGELYLQVNGGVPEKIGTLDGLTQPF